MAKQKQMEADLCTGLGGTDGIFERPLGVHEGKKEVVAVADDHRFADDGCIDRHVERIGRCPIYLYTILRRDHND